MFLLRVKNKLVTDLLFYYVLSMRCLHASNNLFTCSSPKLCGAIFLKCKFSICVPLLQADTLYGTKVYNRAGQLQTT